MPITKGYGMIKVNYIKLILITLFCLILCSCTLPPPHSHQPQVAPPDTVAHFLKTNPSVKKALRKHNVLVYQNGDEILMILPADEFFIQGSTNFIYKTLPTIQTIACLINHFEVIDIKVAGYTDNIGPQIRNMAISREWAQIVAHDVWALCPDARIVYATGYGEFDPITSNDSSTGQAQNRRIEITLRLPPPSILY